MGSTGFYWVFTGFYRVFKSLIDFLPVFYLVVLVFLDLTGFYPFFSRRALVRRGFIE